MLKNKILGAIALFIGGCWLIGGIIGATNGIITGYILQDISYSIGFVLGAGSVAVLGYYVTVWGYDKIKNKKHTTP